jgi:hypothetical protein
VYFGLTTWNLLVGFRTESYYDELAETLSENNIAAYSEWTEDNVEEAEPVKQWTRLGSFKKASYGIMWV